MRFPEIARGLAVMLLAASFPAKAATLPIGQVFDQGDTQWCWAYSAFHTLRTYNDDTASPDSSVLAWKAALHPLDSPDAFERYMADRFSEGRTGDPMDLISLLQNEQKLPDEGWRNFYPSNRASVREARALASGKPMLAALRMSSGEILQKVGANLEKGIPSVYCTPPHCMEIYGDATNSNGIRSFAIADSSGGYTRNESFDEVDENLDLVVTLP